jgi:hypothetical protein
VRVPVHLYQTALVLALLAAWEAPLIHAMPQVRFTCTDGMMTSLNRPVRGPGVASGIFDVHVLCEYFQPCDGVCVLGVSFSGLCVECPLFPAAQVAIVLSGQGSVRAEFTYQGVRFRFLCLSHNPLCRPPPLPD